MKSNKCLLVALLLAICMTLGPLAAIAETRRYEPMSDEEWVALLYGSWHASEPMGRGYGRRALFGEDVCYLLPDEEESAGDAFEGNYWTVVDGILEIHHGEGEDDYVLLFSLHNVTDDDQDEDDILYEVLIGDTIFFKYLDEIDEEIDLDAYTLYLYFDNMDWLP